MVELFSIESLFTLLMLIMLQAVLGFDNLLYIAIESNQVAPENAAKVRRWGIILAMVFRIVLLVIIVQLFAVMQGSLFHIPFTGFLEGEFTLQALVTLFGGAFIIYTAVKEITHMLTVDHIEHSEGTGRQSLAKAIALIVMMNLVFSFDSILSAMAIASIKDGSGVTTGYQMEVMVIAILLSSLAMLLMADRVTEFLKKNRMYEVMGLFILFLVGVLLVTEGAHLAHLTIFTYPIEAMSKSSFYLVVGVLVVTDVISSKYQKRLWAQKEAEIRSSAEMAGAKAVDEFIKTH